MSRLGLDLDEMEQLFVQRQLSPKAKKKKAAAARATARGEGGGGSGGSSDEDGQGDGADGAAAKRRTPALAAPRRVQYGRGTTHGSHAFASLVAILNEHVA